jgi:hypothetical protein
MRVPLRPRAADDLIESLIEVLPSIAYFRGTNMLEPRMVEHILKEIASLYDRSIPATLRREHEANPIKRGQARKPPGENVARCERTAETLTSKEEALVATRSSEPLDRMLGVDAIDMQFDEEGDNRKILAAERHLFGLGRLTGCA